MGASARSFWDFLLVASRKWRWTVGTRNYFCVEGCIGMAGNGQVAQFLPPPAPGQTFGEEV